MKLTTTQLRNIVKTEVKRLGGKGLNEAPRRADGRPGPVDDESDRARARRGRAPMPAAEGTVGWLISQLRKMPADMPVMFGDDDAFQVAGIIEIKHLDDGIEVEDGEGLDVVCIMS